MPQFTDLLIQNGVSEETVAWLLTLPVAVTFVVMARQIVGIKGFGIAVPLFIGFAISSLGFQAGFLIFSIGLAVIFAARLVLAKTRLLYLPKVGLMTIAAIAGLLTALPFLPYQERVNPVLAAFSLVIIALSMEQFSSSLIERGPRRTLAVLIETLLVALPVSFLLNSELVKALVFAYPVFILAILIVFNLLLGKWTGLRISEFLRFKSIIFK